MLLNSKNPKGSKFISWIIPFNRPSKFKQIDSHKVFVASKSVKIDVDNLF